MQNKRIVVRSINSLVGLVCTVMLGACGGSGSSTPTTPTVPPNSAPVISYSVSPNPVEERGSVTLDASASTDVNGDVLTYAWSQTAGPSVSFDPGPSAAIVTFTAPSVAADTTLSFTIQVGDGKTTVSDNFDMTVSNIVLSPTYVIGGTVSSTSVNPASAPQILWDELVGTLTAAGQIVFEQFLDRDAPTDAPALVPIAGPRAAAFPGDSMFVNFIARAAFDYDAFAVKPSDNEVELLRFNRSSDVTTSNVLSVPAPCGADVSYRYRLKLNFSVLDPLGTDGIIVARQGGGFSIFETTAPDTYQERMVTGNPSGIYCDFVATNRYINSPFNTAQGINPFGFGYAEGGNLVLGFDRNTQMVSLFKYTQNPVGPDLIMTEIESMPIDLQTPDALTFVGSTVLDAYVPTHEDKAQAGLALIFTDGQSEGTHRLVVIGIAAGDTITQTTKSWDRGVPIRVEQGQIHAIPPNPPLRFESTSDEIIVLTDTLDALIVFRQANFRSLYVFDSPVDFARLPIEDAAYLPITQPADGIGFSQWLSKVSLRRSVSPEVEVLEFTPDP